MFPTLFVVRSNIVTVCMTFRSPGRPVGSVIGTLLIYKI